MVLAMLQKIEKYLSINLEVLLLYIKNLIKFINIENELVNFIEKDMKCALVEDLIITFYWDVYTPYLKTLYIRQ